MNCASLLRCGAMSLMFAGSLLFRLSADPALDKLLADGKFKEAIDYADEKYPTAQRDAGLWIKVAQANEGMGMPEKALACYLVSWRLSPDNYQALFGAAKIYNKMNQPDNALNMAKSALEKNFTAEASWEFAQACIALNRVVEAKGALEKVIQGDPENVIANRELGNIYYNENSFAKALPLLKKTAKIKPDGELSFKIGKCYVATNTPDSAIVYLKDAINKGVSPNEATLELARAYYGQGNFASAATQYQKLSGEGMNAMDFYHAAQALEKSNNQQAAFSNYERAVSLFGAEKSKEALLAREKVARHQLDGKVYNMALGHFEFIAEADPKGTVVPDIYFLLADAYQGTDNGPRAITCLEKAIALNNKNIEAYARLADLYAKNGMPEKAKQTFEAMMSLSPNDPNVYLSLGQYNLKAKKWQDAYTQFQKSNSLKKSAVASEGTAIAAFNLNRFDAASDAAETAISLDPNSWESRVILAKMLLQAKNYKEAQPHLEFMVKKEPANLDFKTQLAACYDKNGEKTKLVDLDKQIVMQDAQNADSRIRLAREADSRKDDKAALPYYKDLFTLQPKNPDVLHRLYEISLKQNNLYDAAMYIGRLIEVKPSAEADRDYGDVLYQLKDYDRALNAYRAAIKLDPTIKGFHKRYAEIVIAKGQTDEVITALSGVVQSGEADFGTYQTMGMIYQKKGNYAKAIEMYQKALQLDPQSSDALSAMAACQAASGSLNDAIISYEQVVMMDTSAKEAMRELGDIYYKQGNTAAAVKNYKRYFSKNPGDELVARRLGKYAFESQSYPDVVKYLSQIQYKTDEDADYGLMYAAAAAAGKQYKDAIRVLESLRTVLRPRSQSLRQVFKSLAEAYEKDGQDAKAAECYGEYCSQPGVMDQDAAYKYAFMLEKTNPAAAQRVYEANTNKYSGDYRNYLRLGLLLSSNTSTLSRAAICLKRTTALAETIPSVWLELAKVYNKLKDDQSELDAYHKYIQSDPQNPEANKRLGIILASKGQLSEAMIYLEIANTMIPNDPDVMTACAKGYLATNRKNEAVELLKKAKTAKPNDLDIRYALFDAYRKTGQQEKARDEIKDITTQNHDSKYLLDYANACIVTGDLKNAESTLEDVLATQADNIDVLMLKAKVLTLNKKYDEAVEVYKEISYINQNHAPSMSARADVYMLQSKPQWAETFYLRAIKADPKFASAELGMARVCRLRKDMTGFQQHLDKAKLLDPFDPDIQDEAKKAGR